MSSRFTTSRMRSELGVELHEFMVALSILLVVFLAARIYLKTATETRRDSSMNTTVDVVPCDGAMGGITDACK